MKYKNIGCCKNHKKILIPKQTLDKLQKGFKRGMALLLSGLQMMAFAACAQEKTTDKNYQESQTTYVDTTKDNHSQVNPELEYAQLHEELLAELQKKEFSEIAKKFFEEVFEKLYTNYPTWQKQYKDMPEVSEYIRDNLIRVIKEDITGANFIEYNSKEGQKLIEEGEPFGLTDYDFKIRMIYVDPNSATETEHADDLENFFHEIAHCKQNNIVYDGSYFKNNENTDQIFIEGGATFHMKFMNPLTPEQYGTYIISNEAGTSTINYSKDNALGYLIELNPYENLVYLVGYDHIDQIEKGKMSIDSIKTSIANQYGEQKAQELWTTMDKWYELYTDDDENWKNNKVYELAIKFQSLCLDCIKEDINRLDPTNKDEIKSFMRVYRNYKMKNLVRVLNVDGQNCTNEVFGIDAIDDMLIDKILESNVVDKFSENEKLNRNVIKCLIYASNEAYYDKEEIYQDIYLPPDMDQAKYEYSEEGKEGHLILTYQNNGEKVDLEITFDNNKIINIQESKRIIEDNEFGYDDLELDEY